MTILTGSAGSHRFSATGSWRRHRRSYLANCREGLDTYSDRHMAKLMGWSRIQIYRAKLLTSLPDSVFETLLAARR